MIKQWHACAQSESCLDAKNPKARCGDAGSGGDGGGGGATGGGVAA